MTSANFATIISDETGTGLAVFGTSPTLTTPVLGVATGTSLDLGGTSLFASRALTVDTGGVFDISTGSASGDDFTINTTQFAIEGDTGQVGIGTASPGGMLTIWNSTGTDFQIVHDGDNWATIDSGASGLLTFNTRTTANAEGAFAFMNGNVGINTTSPLTKLDVAGSSRIKGSATSVLTGTIDPAASTTVTGVGTAFTTELVVGDRITVTGETRTVTAIATTTSLTVDTAFTDNANDTAPDKLAAQLIIKDSSDNVDFIVQDNGYVGIGTATPAELLDVEGNIEADAYLYSSDRALKKEITTITNPLDKVRALRGVNFKWKADDVASIGFIAQEVESVIPEIVSTHDTDGLKAVQYGNITALLVEAMKAQQVQIEELQETVENLQSSILNLQ
jgi:hypothetical protein